MNIREMIKELMVTDSHELILKHIKKPIVVRYGKPDDEYLSYSVWKSINGVFVCRLIDCYIPEEVKTIVKTDISKYSMGYNSYLIPEKVFNELLSELGKSGHRVDRYQSFSVPYFILNDMLDTPSDWESVMQK